MLRIADDGLSFDNIYNVFEKKIKKKSKNNFPFQKVNYFCRVNVL